MKTIIDYFRAVTLFLVIVMIPIGIAAKWFDATDVVADTAFTIAFGTFLLWFTDPDRG